MLETTEGQVERCASFKLIGVGNQIVAFSVRPVAKRDSTNPFVEADADVLDAMNVAAGAKQS